LGNFHSSLSGNGAVATYNEIKRAKKYANPACTFDYSIEIIQFNLLSWGGDSFCH